MSRALQRSDDEVRGLEAFRGWLETFRGWLDADVLAVAKPA
jgi:hypothetical protein